MKGLLIGLIGFVFLGCVTVDKSVNFRNLDLAIEQTCKNIQNDFVEDTSIAVFGIISSSIQLSEYIMEEAMNNFTNMHKYNVVERNRISTILEEQNFQLSGNVSDDTIQRIGSMLGAQFVITGTLDDVGKYYRLRLFVIAVESGERKSSTAVNIIKPNEQITYLSDNEIIGNIDSFKNELEGAWEGSWYGNRMRVVITKDTATWYGGWASFGGDSYAHKYSYLGDSFYIFDDDGKIGEVWSVKISGDNMIFFEGDFMDKDENGRSFSEDMSGEIFGHFKRMK